MSSKKTIKSAFESMLFTWGEPLEAKAAADVFNITRQTLWSFYCSYLNSPSFIFSPASTSMSP